jgi:predicted DCC family thiol-disulfide oxidoreductase YuxK
MERTATTPCPAPDDRIEVLYNESCPICSREIAAYARAAKRSGAAVDFVPLGSADLRDWGLGPEEARRRLHLRSAGRVTSGLPAFAELWAALPGTRWLARLVSVRPVRPLAAALYDHVLAPLLHALDRRRRRRTAAMLSRGGGSR